LLQPLRCRLRPDTGDARDVVDGVADEREIVGDLLGRNAELLLDARAIERRIIHRVDERDLPVDELRQVLVAGRDHGRGTGGRGLPSQRADDVVRFDACDAQDRDAHRLDGFEQRPYLHLELVRHRRPIGFVLGVQLAAKGLAGRVEHDGHVSRLPLVEELVQHVDDAEHRVRRLAALRRERR
jgi:hypothetical protein